MKILSLFACSKEELELKQQERIGKALERGQEALIDDLEGKIDTVQGAIEKMTEGDINKIDTKTFNTQYHKLMLDKIILTQELKVAYEVKEALYVAETKTTKKK